MISHSYNSIFVFKYPCLFTTATHLLGHELMLCVFECGVCSWVLNYRHRGGDTLQTKYISSILTGSCIFINKNISVVVVYIKGCIASVYGANAKVVGNTSYKTLITTNNKLKSQV